MAKKTLYDEDGNVVKGAKVKKPFYTRWWFIALVAMFIIGAISGGEDGESLETTEAETEEVVEKTEPEEAEEIEEVVEEELEEAEEERADIPREHRNALSSAENYIRTGMGFSETGLAKQLEFESFPQDAINYALENIDADYNEQALLSAENYDATGMGFSDQGLMDQLKYEGFTDEQARYAVENLQ